MTLSFLLLAPAAMAQNLDCTDLQQTSCDAANQVIALVNQTAGESIVGDAAALTRMRTSAIYNRFRNIEAALDGSGCTVDGVMGGTYANLSEFEGRWESSDGTQSGTVNDGAQRIRSVMIADYSGNASGMIGGSWGRPTGGNRLAADMDGSGFVAGYWVRIAGLNGIWTSFSGSCGENDAAAALSGWFGDALEPTSFDDVHPMLVAECGACHSADFGSADAGVALAALSQPTCFPGSTLCADIALDLINGGHMPIAAPLEAPQIGLYEQWFNNSGL